VDTNLIEESMSAYDEISYLISEAEDSNHFEEGTYKLLLAIAKMKLYLNKEKLDTIEVK